MRTLVMLVLVMSVPLASRAQVSAPRDTGGPVIAVSGEGTSSLPPDELIVQLGVETRAKTAGKAGADNADRMAAVRKALLALGLQEKEISTAFYNIRMEMYPSPRDTAYVASNSVQIDTRKLGLVSKIIDTALESGANNIASVRYTLADSRDAIRSALANAVEDARLQAEALAKAAGGKLGDLLDLNATTGRPIPYQVQGAGGFAMGRVAAETPISERDITVHASVSARWRFLPAR
jgi:uncharacterized protein